MGNSNGMYDVGPAMQGGSGAINPGSNAYYGFQRELMRRMQQEELAKAQVRQKQLDDTAKAVAEASIANTTENTKSLAAERAANASKTNLTNATQGLTAGDSLTDEQANAIQTNGGGGFLLRKPAVPAMMGGGPIADPTEADMAATPPTEAVPASVQFKGTAKDQDEAKFEQYANDVIAGKHDTGDENLDRQMKAWATSKLMGKEMNGAAGVLNPKAGPGEKDTSKHLDIASRAAQGQTVTPAEAAWDAEYLKQHPNEDTKQKNRATNIYLSGGLATDRQQAGFTHQDQRDVLNTIGKSYADLNIPKISKLLQTLNGPGGVADVVAVPEFLSALAGGQGAGLRMSQAELNMIQNARPLLDSLVIKAGNIVGWNPNGYAALTAGQKQQMSQLIKEVATNNYNLGQKYVAAQDAIVKDPSQALQIQADLKRDEMAVFGELAGIPGAGSNKSSGGLPPGVTVRKH